MRGDSAPSRQAGEGVAGALAASTGGSDENDARDGRLIATARCLTARHGMRLDWETKTFVTHTLRGDGFDASEDGTGRGTPLVPMAFSCKDHGADAGGLSPTLRAMGHDGSHANAGGQVAVAFGTQMSVPHWAVGFCDTLQAKNAKGVALGSAVRRLTPRECERLQGIPDDHTLVPYCGKPMADGPRYKLVGNSWAVPVARWIFNRVDTMDAILRRRVAA